MNAARLSARWQGHQVGSLVYGKDADAAVRAGVAVSEDQAPADKITTGTTAGGETAPRKRTRRSKPSPTRETTTEETTSDDDDRTRGSTDAEPG